MGGESARVYRGFLSRNRMNNSLTVPIAIVVAGALIAGALFFAGRAAAPSAPSDTARPDSVPPITDADHILGSPQAKVVIIEYSDIECPFCKQFHVTMQQIMREYGESGSVAWVYRHFPLAQLHPNAPRLAEASECVAELAGTNGFWTFLDEVFAAAPGNARFPMDKLAETAAKAGASESAFTACIESGKHKATVEGQFKDAVATGGQGTPHNLILVNGEVIPLPGAQPYATIKQVIETALGQ